jgi:hypothetical protein
MIDVIVTVASLVGYADPYVVTKVHRLEFETQEQVDRWLATGATRAVNSEQLMAKEYTNHPAPPDGLPGFEVLRPDPNESLYYE